MKHVLLTALLCLTVAACDSGSTVTQPVAPASPMEKLLVTVDFTLEQQAVVDELYYLGEDLGLVCTPAQVDAIESVTGPGLGILGDLGTTDSRIGLDMEALLYFDLIRKANPNMDPRKLEEIRRLIAENYRLRLAAMKNATDRTSLAAQLQALHEKLMRQINALLTREELANVEALKARIEKDRLDTRARLDAARIAAQVQLMTRVLGLGDRQAAEVKRLLTTQLAEIAKLQAQYRNNPEALRAALVRLQAQYDEMMHKLLGDELWRKWIAYRTRGVITTSDRTDTGTRG